MSLTRLRLDSLEQEVASLRARLDRLEGSTAAAPAPAPAPPAAVRPAPPPRPSLPPRPTAPARPVNLEDLLGRRLLGLTGGAAVLLGVAFFVALAVGRGWIGETARVSLAATASTALLAAGVWLYGKRGRLQAALAMVATAIASGYLTLAATTALYHLLPTWVALPVALAIGGVATAIAVRWNTRTVAGLGIGGALVAPALAGSLTTASMLFLAVAFGCSGAVLVWRRWDWLAVGAFLVSAVQLAGWLLSKNPADSHVVAVLALFAGLNLAGILGHELRLGTRRLRPSTSALALAGALSFGGLGYMALDAGGIWLAALAGAHALAGGVALVHRRVSDEIGLLLLATSLTLADVAFGALAHGPALAIGWALSAAVLAAAVRRLTHRVELVQLTVGGQLALAVAHALMFDAQPGSISAGTADLGTAGSTLAAIALAAFACARQTVDENPRWRAILDGLSLAALALVTAAMLDGTALVLAWAVESVALAQLAQRMRDGVARAAALAFLALAAAHAFVFEAMPRALVYGVDDLLAAAVALGLVAGGALVCSRVGPVRSTLERPALEAVAVGCLLYLASIAIITPFQPGPDVVETGLGLSVRQQGQVLLSAFWGGCGLVGLWVGLRRDERRIRLAAFGLLALAVAKVFLYDLSTLASVYRVLSFVAVGLLLLAAAFAYQRLRPTETQSGAA